MEKHPLAFRQFSTYALCDVVCRGDVRTRSREQSAVSTERRDDRYVAERGVTDDGWLSEDDRGCQMCQVTDRCHLPDRKSDTFVCLFIRVLGRVDDKGHFAPIV